MSSYTHHAACLWVLAAGYWQQHALPSKHTRLALGMFALHSALPEVQLHPARHSFLTAAYLLPTRSMLACIGRATNK
jgi:hypothetical protein